MPMTGYTTRTTDRPQTFEHGPWWPCPACIAEEIDSKAYYEIRRLRRWRNLYRITVIILVGCWLIAEILPRAA